LARLTRFTLASLKCTSLRPVQKFFFGLNRSKMTGMDKMLCSLFGGFFSSLSTLPLDVIVSQIQQSKNSGRTVKPLAEIKQNYKEGGLKRMKSVYTRGVEARILHVALTTVAMKTWNPMFHNFMFGDN